MRALCWEGCLWMFPSQGPTACLASIKSTDGGGDPDSCIQGAVPMASANSTSQARVDNSISVLGCRQPDYLGWFIRLSAASALEVPKLWSPRLTPWGPWENAELERMGGQWQGDGGPVSGSGEFHPIESKGCRGCCFLGLLCTNEIKMPKACLCTHLLKNTWLELLNEC